MNGDLKESVGLAEVADTANFTHPNLRESRDCST